MDDWSDVLVAVLKFALRYPEVARFLAAKVGFPIFRQLVWSVAVLVRNDKHTLDTDEWVDQLFSGEHKSDDSGLSPEELWNMHMDDLRVHVSATHTEADPPEDDAEAPQPSVEQSAEQRQKVHPLDGPGQPV